MNPPSRKAQKYFRPLYRKSSFSPLLCPKQFAPFLGEVQFFAYLTGNQSPLFTGSPKLSPPTLPKVQNTSYHPHPVNNEVSLGEGL